MSSNTTTLPNTAGAFYLGMALVGFSLTSALVMSFGGSFCAPGASLGNTTTWCITLAGLGIGMGVALWHGIRPGWTWIGLTVLTLVLGLSGLFITLNVPWA